MSSRTHSLSLALGVVGLLLVIGIGAPRAQTAPQGRGEMAPSFALQDLTGRTLSLKDFEEKNLTLLIFFLTDTRAAVDTLKVVDDLFRPRLAGGTGVLAISLDDSTETKEFVKPLNLSFPVALDKGETWPAFGAGSTPTVVVLDSDHRILDVMTGGPTLVVRMLQVLAQREIDLDSEVAEEAATRMMEREPSDVEARLLLAQVLIRKGAIDRAEQILPDDAMDPRAQTLTFLARAEIANRRGDWEVALNWTGLAEKLDPASGAIALVRGEAREGLGQNETALEDYRKSVRQEAPYLWQRSRALGHAGRLLWAKGQREEAARSFERAVEADGNSALARIGRAVTRANPGGGPEAAVDLRRAARLDPRDDLARVLLRCAEERAAETAVPARPPDEVPRLALVDIQYGSNATVRTGAAEALTCLLKRFLGEAAEVNALDPPAVERLSSQSIRAGLSLTLEGILGKDLAEKLVVRPRYGSTPGTVTRDDAVRAARWIGAGHVLIGSFQGTGRNSALLVNLIDTKTSSKVTGLTVAMNQGLSLESIARGLASEISFAAKNEPGDLPRAEPGERSVSGGESVLE